MGGEAMAFVDLSHTIEDGMITYPGLPAPRISTYLSFEASRTSYGPQTEFQIGRIDLVANTGTYLDAPAHRFVGAPDLADLPLERLADLPICLVRPSLGPDERAIGPQAFAGLELAGRAVLIHTGWDRHWGTDAYLSGNPFLTGPAAEMIANAGAALVGIDSLNVDDTGDPARPAHTAILRAHIPLVEHLCRLDAVPPSGGCFFAVPVKVRGMATFPVRAFAIVRE
jgi:kynurenine formamidase